MKLLVKAFLCATLISASLFGMVLGALIGSFANEIIHNLGGCFLLVISSTIFLFVLLEIQKTKRLEVLTYKIMGVYMVLGVTIKLIY
jgi:hypothetical protein